MNNWNLINEGKVRQIYESEDHLAVALVASDRVSAFDEELGVVIPGKGRMLTEISKYWFEKTNKIVPNAYIALQQLATDFDLPAVDPNTVTPMLKLNMLPIEAIVRGYITGSIWAAYDGPQKAREFCGLKLPDGMKNSEQFEDPLFTPTTKAPKGEHDQNLSFEEMVKHLEENGIMGARDRAQLIRDYSLSLYNFARNKLVKRGIILADTKFEFGINPITGNLMLGDELFTPDSSRFWLLKDYTIGQNQKSMDKQIIRDWVRQHPSERVTQAVLEKTSIVYSKITDALIEREGARKLI